MEIGKAKRLRHFLRLSYPLHVVAGNSGFIGWHPDLPDCGSEAEALPALYARLELRRRAWLTERVLAEAPIPAPNASAPLAPPVLTQPPMS